jgi:hypothetical protein
MAFRAWKGVMPFSTQVNAVSANTACGNRCLAINIERWSRFCGAIAASLGVTVTGCALIGGNGRLFLQL